MKITIEETIELMNVIDNGNAEAFKQGVKKEKERPLPNSFFDVILKYAMDSKTYINHHTSQSKLDGCNWIQLKPTRTDSKAVKAVEISFNENLMEIDFIGVVKK